MYKVIEDFVDLKDRCYPYKAGDTYPRKGANIPDERIAELSGSDNARKHPVIEKVAAQRKKPASKAKKEE